MFHLLWLTGLLLEVATWGLLIGFGIWLSRRLPLRSLPWLGGYLALSIAWGLVKRVIILALVDRGAIPFHWTAGEFLVHWAYGEMVLQWLIRLVLVVMILAEITHMVSFTAFAPNLRPFGPFLAIQARPWPFGITLVALSFVGPMVAGVLWLV